MGAKEFKAIGGLANNETTQNIITQAITSNSATTIDTVSLASFYSIKYDITIVQGSKVRTSTLSVQTDGTSVDSTEYGIVTTGGAISGVAVTTSVSGGNMLLQITITDAASTIARVRSIKNITGVIQPYLPSAPTIGTGTVATGQSYTGSANVSVSFTAPVDNGLSSILSYTVTSSSGATATGSSSPISISDIVGTARTYTITATNSIGTSLASSATSSVTPSSVPQAPTIGTATNNSGTISVTFTAGATGGSSITGYTVTSSSGATGTGASSPITVTETVAGTYTYTVRATNANGNSSSSSASNSISFTPPITGDGYFAGGANYSGGSPKYSSIDKLSFNTDSISTISATLSAPVGYVTGASNSGVAGYAAGGITAAGNTNIIDKLLYSNDTKSTLSATLSVAKRSLGGASNSGVAGYFAGGVPSALTDVIEKLLYSNESRSTLSAVLSAANANSSGMANSGTAAYFVVSTSVDKIAFSNDSRSTLASIYSSSKNNTSAFANSGTAGYHAGSTVYANATVIDKIAFSNDTKSTLSAVLSEKREGAGGLAKSGQAGYIAGGDSPAGAFPTSNTINKLIFSSDTVSTLAATLSAQKQGMAALANSGIL